MQRKRQKVCASFCNFWVFCSKSFFLIYSFSAEPEEVPINKAKRADEDDDFFHSDTESDTEDGGKGDESGDDDASETKSEPSGMEAV